MTFFYCSRLNPPKQILIIAAPAIIQDFQGAEFRVRGKDSEWLWELKFLRFVFSLDINSQVFNYSFLLN